jgi:imidazole glycerol-phosphate synthase subunit HisH
MTQIAIVDYGMGNLRSVAKALERVGAEPVVTRDLELIATAPGTLLPGVGAFPEAMRHVDELGMAPALADRVAAGRPTLGICLGLQLLFSHSRELGGSPGLGLLDGEVTALLAPGLKVPHIGWARVEPRSGSPLFEGLGESPAFYFVHSYAFRPAEPADVLGIATYGERFCCAVERGALWGVQFHPEKSSGAGLGLLANFLTMARARVPA